MYFVLHNHDIIFLLFNSMPTVNTEFNADAFKFFKKLAVGKKKEKIQNMEMRIYAPDKQHKRR